MSPPRGEAPPSSLLRSGSALVFLAFLMVLAGCGRSLSEPDRSGLESTVHIRSEACPPPHEGTGATVGPELVVTAAHTVVGAERLTVTSAKGDTFTGFPVVVDTDLDYAVVRVPGLDAEPLPLATGSRPAAERVLLFRTGRRPEAASVEFLMPVVMATTDIYREGEVNRQAFEITFAAQPGDSGAVVLDGEGRVTGIVISVSVEEPVTFVLDVSEWAQSVGGAPDEVAPPGRCMTP